ncbi:hypothetical protein BDK51DRAFT_30408 [Blyttiomyces helicus]|uniref:Uncharacterized protein n=1 Tax=Blyttiomyces helicus TaxID=388810 RepID=A0A4P9WFH5_9FUNG|nr:hypothetical protein BDK51DRAFT_30408 [Blyttiomyces helicus]|eukprot:RKO91374.1 hypothetical protein BDK51DRAFT_30408 [Blyttiomyces helicus]
MAGAQATLEHDVVSAPYIQIFISLAPSAAAFSHLSCLLAKDATFTKTTLNETQLITTGLSGNNNNILPLAFTLVPSKDGNTWLLYKLRAAIPMLTTSTVLNLWDRNKGLLGSVDANLKRVMKKKGGLTARAQHKLREHSSGKRLDI